MFTHVYLGTNDLERAAHFYDAVLGALGHKRVPVQSKLVYSHQIGTLIIGLPANGKAHTPSNGLTLGLRAANHAAVDEFHALGVANGATDEGAPGHRPNSPGNQYGAYLKDPDGNKICAYAPCED